LILILLSCTHFSMEAKYAGENVRDDKGNSVKTVAVTKPSEKPAIQPLHSLVDGQESKTFPVYPVTQGKKIIQVPGIRGKVVQYETSDPMEKVVEFYQNRLKTDYQMIAFGLVEFVIEHQNMQYTFESPSYGRPELERHNQTKSFDIKWRLIRVHYNPYKDVTEITTYDLNKEDMIKKWRKDMQEREEVIKRGPQLYKPEMENKSVR